VGKAIAAPFERDLIALMPSLRAFSRLLCTNRTLADDITQQALMKAWRAQNSFETGTNLKAWLFTILRNEFYGHCRRAWRETHWDADIGEGVPAPPKEQDWALELSDTTRALGTLPQTQQQALILVAALGFSFEGAAKLCGTPVGTVKSRVSRGREHLVKILGDGKSLPDRRTQGVGHRKFTSEDILAELSALAPTAASAYSQTHMSRALQC
jgi:RNA polymerase sigma-70 factor (ECF subfamily)